MQGTYTRQSTRRISSFSVQRPTDLHIRTPFTDLLTSLHSSRSRIPRSWIPCFQQCIIGQLAYCGYPRFADRSRTRSSIQDSTRRFGRKLECASSREEHRLLVGLDSRTTAIPFSIASGTLRHISKTYKSFSRKLDCGWLRDKVEELVLSLGESRPFGHHAYPTKSHRRPFLYTHTDLG